MISESTRQILQRRCKTLCQTHSLGIAYVAQVLGPRRHYLAGYGLPTAEPTGRLSVSDDIVLFWQGDLTEQAGLAFCDDLKDTVFSIERELAGCDTSSRTNCHSRGD